MSYSVTTDLFASKLDAIHSIDQSKKYNVVDLGNMAGSITIDLSVATEFTGVLTASTTIAFSNVPAANQSQVVYLRLTNGGAFKVTWPTSTKFAKATAPVFTDSGVDLIGIKYDSVTSTYMVFVIELDVR